MESTTGSTRGMLGVGRNYRRREDQGGCGRMEGPPMWSRLFCGTLGRSWNTTLSKLHRTNVQLAGEYGLRNKREIWRIQLTLSKVSWHGFPFFHSPPPTHRPLPFPLVPR